MASDASTGREKINSVLRVFIKHLVIVKYDQGIEDRTGDSRWRTRIVWKIE
jgi:hypothetical protein